MAQYTTPHSQLYERNKTEAPIRSTANQRNRHEILWNIGKCDGQKQFIIRIMMNKDINLMIKIVSPRDSVLYLQFLCRSSRKSLTVKAITLTPKAWLHGISMYFIDIIEFNKLEPLL